MKRLQQYTHLDFWLEDEFEKVRGIGMTLRNIA
jgi:hypothetical protein